MKFQDATYDPRWFALPTAGGLHFGNLGRNSVLGPNFRNLDFSITKVTKLTERISHEFRFETFDLFNHPNFGNPGLTAGNPGAAASA